MKRNRPRHTSDRERSALSGYAKGMEGGIAFILLLLIVVVIGAVFLGSKMWHSLFGGGNDFTGDGVNDVVIQVHDGDS